MRSSPADVLVSAVLLGVASGMRSMLPLALVSLSPAGPRRLRPVLLPLALTELVGDKLPQVPSRLAPVPLVVRMIAGGLGGAWLARAAGTSAGPAVVVGALGALLGAVSGHFARARLPVATGTADAPWAVLEDLTAGGLAATALRLVAA